MAWILTNIQIIRTQKRVGTAQEAIKLDIDAKRASTEAFVHHELQMVREDVKDAVQRLESTRAEIGGFEARMTAQMPPNVHGELQELKEALEILERAEGLNEVRSEIEAINVGLRKEFEELPGRIKGFMMAEASAEARQMMIVAKEKAGELRSELAAVNAQLPQGFQAGDIRGSILKAITREPTAKERKDMGTIGEMIWNFGRMKAAEYLQNGDNVPNSVTYTVKNSKSPYGL